MSASTGLAAASSALVKSICTEARSTVPMRSSDWFHSDGSSATGVSLASAPGRLNSSRSTSAPRANRASNCSWLAMNWPRASSKVRSASRTLKGSGAPSVIRCLTVDRGQNCMDAGLDRGSAVAANWRATRG